MAKRDGVIEIEGAVVEAFPNVMSHVELENGHVVLIYISGKTCQHYTKVLLEGRVAVELTPYDLSRGCTVYHYK